MTLTIILSIMAILGMFICILKFPTIKIKSFQIDSFYLPILLVAIIFLIFPIFDKSELVDILFSNSSLNPLTPLKTTTFPSDGSILDTYSPTETMRTVFNSDGSISEIYTKDGNVIEHKTIFNTDGSISVVDVPQP